MSHNYIVHTFSDRGHFMEDSCFCLNFDAAIDKVKEILSSAKDRNDFNTKCYIFKVIKEFGIEVESKIIKKEINNVS